MKEKLNRQKNEGIIEVTEPTDWCAPIVPVETEKFECVDLNKLNKCNSEKEILC